MPSYSLFIGGASARVCIKRRLSITENRAGLVLGCTYLSLYLTHCIYLFMCFYPFYICGLHLWGWLVLGVVGIGLVVGCSYRSYKKSATYVLNIRKSQISVCLRISCNVLVIIRVTVSVSLRIAATYLGIVTL